MRRTLSPDPFSQMRNYVSMTQQEVSNYADIGLSDIRAHEDGTNLITSPRLVETLISLLEDVGLKRFAEVTLTCPNDRLTDSGQAPRNLVLTLTASGVKTANLRWKTAQRKANAEIFRRPVDRCSSFQSWRHFNAGANLNNFCKALALPPEVVVAYEDGRKVGPGFARALSDLLGPEQAGELLELPRVSSWVRR